MKSEARSRLRSIVESARRVVEEDTRAQLRMLGIKGNEMIPIGRLEHLGEELVAKRHRIEEAIKKEKAGPASQNDAFERYVRHVGFTFMNRVAAFRALEVRGLLSRETIVRREKYAGYSAREYEVAERYGIADPEKVAKNAFDEACKEISAEIAVLFDLDDAYSVLFPSARVVAQVYDYFGKEIPEEDWLSDDVIGWIYQYYNSDARKECRRRARRPKADDIPILNQFYTSDWIVKALVDNTLGRLWLESQSQVPRIGEGIGSARKDTVKGFCNYLIPADSQRTRDHINPQDIKILDPACGSGHFLVYTFDLMFLIYREHDPSLSTEEICRRILEKNLYGIDIDLRAVQLAALSLYLKAKKHSPKTRIGAMNLVCADARIIDGSMRKRFLNSLEPNLDLQRVFAKLFEELAFTYHLGSLFRVSDRFQDVIGQPAYQTSLASFNDDTRQVKSNKDESRPTLALEQMLAVLRDFEREAMDSHDMGTLLFTTEAGKSTGLLSLLTQKYDVVVMNPPYGSLPEEAKTYAKKHYPRTHHDYYAAFIEQAVNLCNENGFVGMLTGRTFMFLKRLEKVRTEILYDDARPFVVFDLNTGPSDAVLDEATGRWAATVARVGKASRRENQALFFRLTTLPGENMKKQGLEEAISCLLDGKKHNIVFRINFDDLKKLPRMPYSYYAPKAIVDLFTEFPPLDRDNADMPDAQKIADLKEGLVTADDRQFVRYWWEVNPDTVAHSREDTVRGKKWVPFATGGDSYHSDVRLVVNWENDGREIREFAKDTGNPCIRNESYYFEEALSWSNIASSFRLDFRMRNKGSIFGHAAHSLFLRRGNRYSVMGLLNSSLVAYLYSVLDPIMHNRSAGYVAQLPVPLEALDSAVLGEASKRVCRILEELGSVRVTSTNFEFPLVLKLLHEHRTNRAEGTSFESFSDLLGQCVEWERERLAEAKALKEKMDREASVLYRLSDEAWSWVTGEVAKILGDSSSEPAEITPTPEADYLAQMLLHYAMEAMKGDSDGILTLPQLVDNVRRLIHRDFGNLQNEVETTTHRLLGKPMLRWFAEDFFTQHVGRYERRPVIWQLTSVGFSSRRGVSAAFDCFLYYQKLDKDTLHKVRSKYLKTEIDAARWRVDGLRKRVTDGGESELADQLNEALATVDELERLDSAIESLHEPSPARSRVDGESDWTMKKTDEVRVNGWSPIIDHGVVVNIRPLQEAGVLHKDAVRVK